MQSEFTPACCWLLSIGCTRDITLQLVCWCCALCALC